MEDRKNIQLLLGALLFMMLISIVSAYRPLYAYEADNQVEIVQPLPATLPIIIDRPGNYVLVNNITVSTSCTYGIEIRANDVTLDLHSYTLTGPGSAGIGIYVPQKDNVEIINGTVQGFSCGISLSGTNHRVSNIKAYNNSSCGIKAESSIINNCLVNSNGSLGIKADSSTIINCTANSNGSHGLRVSSSTITNCVATSNGSHGLYAVNKCRLERNTLMGNGGYGLYLDTDYSYAINNTAINNASGNFHLSGTHYLPTSGNEANSE